MVSCQKLDAPCRACTGRVTLLLTVFMTLASCPPAPAQNSFSDSARISAVQKAFDAGHWEDAANLARGPADQSPEMDFLAGLALAKLQRWEESRLALQAGRRKAPSDPRFLVELAGVDYRQRNFRSAKQELRAALQLDEQDAYAREFLGTLYFLESNLEAALKYWNAIDKPRLRNVSVLPPPHVNGVLFHRAVGFNAPQVLTRQALLGTEARLDTLGIYPGRLIELTPVGTGNYDATLRLPERDGWGNSRLEGALSLLSGLPYATVYPEFYDLGHQAVNFRSLVRWDSEKRRAYASLSTPLMHDPALRFQAYFDGRNENWNLTNTFLGNGAPLSDLNIRRIAAGAELRSVANGWWSWSAGLEVANRTFRNLAGHTSQAEKPFFTDGTSFAYWLRVNRSLVRLPERRFTIESSAEARVGREFTSSAESFGMLRGSLSARWFPRANGDDYQMEAQLRGGDTFGPVPFDELFQLGIERDNDLWLRGHAGTSGGRKGAAPLGRRYFLANWSLDKNVYENGFFTVKLGPFLDNGAIADSSGLFGSRRWLWDTGAQCKVRILGAVTVVLSYGRDLRGGRNVFYGTALR
jgi:tetratricopeptide (TPR) repeat protein